MSDLEQALIAARARGRAYIEDLIKQPHMLRSQEFASRCGVNRSTIFNWRTGRKIIAICGPKRGFRFPSWQIGSDGKPFKALSDLLDLFGDAWRVYLFLASAHPELTGITGHEALRLGLTKNVLDTADTVLRGDYS